MVQIRWSNFFLILYWARWLWLFIYKYTRVFVQLHVRVRVCLCMCTNVGTHTKNSLKFSFTLSFPIYHLSEDRIAMIIKCSLFPLQTCGMNMDIIWTVISFQPYCTLIKSNCTMSHIAPTYNQWSLVAVYCLRLQHWNLLFCGTSDLVLSLQS